MADLALELAQLNVQARELLARYDGVFEALDEKTQNKIIEIQNKAEELKAQIEDLGVNIDFKLNENGMLVKNDGSEISVGNALKLGGKSWEELKSEIGIVAQPTSFTLDIFGDGSRIAFYDFENSLNDTSGVYNGEWASTNNIGDYTTGVSGNGLRIDAPYEGVQVLGITPKAITMFFKYFGNVDRQYIVDNRFNGGNCCVAFDPGNVLLAKEVAKFKMNGTEYFDGDTLVFNDGFNFIYIEFTNPLQDLMLGNFYQLSDGGGSNYYANGVFDMVSIFNRALSDTELVQLQNEGA